MQIQRNRIRNPKKYLYSFSPGDGIYIALKVPTNMTEKLLEYGITDDNVARIPIPNRVATSRNANGYWKIRKDLPKKPRDIERYYHTIDWHGGDHYGTCWQTRICYQREHIQPTELTFSIEQGNIYSQLFHNIDEDMEFIKNSINILLEIFGFCELWTAEKAPPVPPMKQCEVPWEILPKGSLSFADWKEQIEKITREYPLKHKFIILHRHEHLWKQKPDSYFIGSQNFSGYIVYGFSDLNLYIFECNQPDNATYIFKGQWEEASRLTKTEVLLSKIHERRLYHTEKWYENINSIIALQRKQANNG